MALGKRRPKGQPLFVETSSLPVPPGHPFYDRVNRILQEAEFDFWVEDLAREFYAEKMGRPGLPPGTYVRLLFIGYFEGIDSERGIAWRLSDSLALRAFLGIGLTERTPDHSTISKTRKRLSLEFHQKVFTRLLEILAERGLVKGQALGVDASTMEANAAMKSLVRRVSGEGYNEYLTRLAKESGIETPTVEDLRRFDKKRKGKKMSNDDWQNPNDPDARIARTKKGVTRMGYKPENVVDLETGAIVSARIHHGNEGDTKTGLESLDTAIANLTEVESDVDEFDAPMSSDVVGDKGYHSGEVLLGIEAVGFTPVVSEPDRGRRKWSKNGEKTDEKAAEQKAVYNNRRRLKRKKGKALHRKRGELLERTFAHLLETGGMRRTWLRGRENVEKRYMVHAAAFNLSLIVRSIIGAGTPREMANRMLRLLQSILLGVNAILGVLRGSIVGSVAESSTPTDLRFPIAS